MKGFGWAVILPFVAKIVAGLVQLVSPEIKGEVATLIKGLHAKAVRTDNPWDAILSTFLADVFDVTVE